MTAGPGTGNHEAGSDFIRSETVGGAALLVAVVAALMWANLAPGHGYFEFWETELTLGFGSFSITEDLQHWINDALMAVFFFVVGLEIKRELAVGELNDRRRAALPVIAATGGVVLPAVIFVLLNLGTDEIGGWAIPMATDIAFAVAVVAVMGSRIPSGARLLLLAIAIVDDLIAIMVIAVFFTDDLQLAWLLPALAGVLVILAMRRFGVARPLFYIPVGLVVWLGFFESGIHSTIAGVVLGLLTPAGTYRGRPVLEDMEHRLHPWSALGIVPLFALANAGVVFGADVIRDAFESTLFWGIAAGLVLGKLLGIGGAILASRSAGIGEVPEGVVTRDIWGIAALGGIGFTVSLFITGLAFDNYEQVEIAKIGIFTGSLVSAALGALILLRPRRARR